MQTLSKHHPGLRCLALNDHGSQVHSVLEKLGTRLHTLSAIAFGNCPERLLIATMNSCINLTKLKTNGSNASLLARLRLPHLRNLHLQNPLTESVVELYVIVSWLKVGVESFPTLAKIKVSTSSKRRRDLFDLPSRCKISTLTEFRF